jgi:exosortase/archaeosortase family protein
VRKRKNLRKRKKNANYYSDLFIRLFAILLVTINFNLFYVVLAPITLYLSYFIINIFYDAVIIGHSIGVSGFGFNIIDACVAGAAYYLLFFLTIGLKDSSWTKRAKMFFSGALILLVVNVLRIFTLVFLNLEFGRSYFEAVHLLFWNFMSGIFIFLIWLFLIKKFKVDGIPFLLDIKYLFENSLLKRNKPKVKK